MSKKIWYHKFSSNSISHTRPKMGAMKRRTTAISADDRDYAIAAADADGEKSCRNPIRWHRGDLNTSSFTALFYNLQELLASPCLILVPSTVVLVCCLIVMMRPSQIPMDDYDGKRATWFGNRMSKEGEWEHIPVVLCATYSFVLAYGALVSLVHPKTHVLSMPLFYCAGLIAFYIWHVTAHTFEGSGLHRVHMLHHQDRYPREDFYGYKHFELQQERLVRGGKPLTLLALMDPTRSTTSSIEHEGPLLLGIGVIIMVANGLLGVPRTTCAFALLGYSFMATFGSAVHMSFHEPGINLEPYAWFRELRSLHMIHHMHRKNYAMVNMLVDFVFGSLLMQD